MLTRATKRIGAVLYFSLNSSISLFILILISIFTTWLLRGWLVVSGVNYTYPTNFVFQPCEKTGVCSYPWALIDLRRPYAPYDSVLSPGLQYSASLRFRVSDSESNRLAGMFMVKFAFQDGYGRMISACTTSTVLPYRSNLVRLIRRLFFWPLMIFDYMQEYHSINVKCPDPLSFAGSAEESALNLRVEIQSVGVQMVNDGRVELFGNLRGLQYYLYWWPIVSTCALFFVVFWCSTSISCGIWLIQYSKKSTTTSPVKNEKIYPELPSPSPRNYETPTYDSKSENEIPYDFDLGSRSTARERKGASSSMLKRMYGQNEDDDDVQCFQRRLSSRMQKALLDLDDSNLGS